MNQALMNSFNKNVNPEEVKQQNWEELEEQRMQPRYPHSFWNSTTCSE